MYTFITFFCKLATQTNAALHKMHMPASPLPLAVQLDLSLHGWQLLVLTKSTAESHFVFQIFSSSLNNRESNDPYRDCGAPSTHLNRIAEM